MPEIYLTVRILNEDELLEWIDHLLDAGVPCDLVLKLVEERMELEVVDG